MQLLGPGTASHRHGSFDQMGGVPLDDPTGSVTPQAPPRPVNSNVAPWWWDASTSIFSQALNTFGGAHTGTQIVNSNDRITAITNPVPVAQPFATTDPNYAAYLAQRSTGGIGGYSTGGTVDSLIQWATQPTNLLIIGVAVAAIFLWKRDPNKKR